MYRLLKTYNCKLNKNLIKFYKAKKNGGLTSNFESDKCLKNPLLKMQTDIRLQNFRLRTWFRKFFTNPPKIYWIHPP